MRFRAYIFLGVILAVLIIFLSDVYLSMESGNSSRERESKERTRMIPATIADIIPITTTTLDGEAENLGQCLEEEEEDGIAFITTRNSASRSRIFE